MPKMKDLSFKDIFRLEKLILEKLEEKKPVNCDGAKKAAIIKNLQKIGSNS